MPTKWLVRPGRYWWVDEKLNPGEGQNSENIAIKLIKDVKDQYKTPTISHLCHQPNPANLPPECGGSVYEASLLVMVYHLIWQLLNLNPPEDKAGIDLKRLQGLNMKMADWETALEIFKKLLEKTPSLDCCIISLLLETEDSNGSQKCEQFLDVLLSVRDSQGLRLIFTFGGSRILKRKENISPLSSYEGFSSVAF